ARRVPRRPARRPGGAPRRRPLLAVGDRAPRRPAPAARRAPGGRPRTGQPDDTAREPGRRVRDPDRPPPARGGRHAMNDKLSPGAPTRYHPLWQLVLARLREFYREPEAIFWVYGFPVLIVVALGIAFRNKPVEHVTVDIQDGSADSTGVDSVRKALAEDE